MVARISIVARSRTKEPNPKTLQGQWSLYLAHAMAKADMTPGKLASDLGCSRAIIFRYLRGDAIPKLDQWEAIAISLGMKSWRELIPTDSFVKNLLKK